MWPVDSLRFRVAGERLVVEEEPTPVQRTPVEGATQGLQVGPNAVPREAVDDNSYLEEAAEFYGVKEHIPALIHVRFKESSNIIKPCVVGLRGEIGPFQFMPSTWAGTPYAHLDSCDLEAATWAAAWKVSQPEGWTAWRSTWPRGGTP